MVVRKIRRYIEGIEIRIPSRSVILAVLVGLLLLGAMSMARASGTPLHELSQGTIINFSGRQWIVLDQMPNGETYIILKETDSQRAFDPDDTNLFNPNDSNNIGYYLNNTFYNSLSQKEYISSHTWDRIAIDDITREDSTDYGNVVAKVGLISYREYESYLFCIFNVIQTSYAFAWTRSPNTAYDGCMMWAIDTTDGDLRRKSAFQDNFSVFPTLYLQPGLMVDQNGTVGESSVKPANPTGLSAVATSPTTVNLTWQPNTEQDLAGYKIYRNNIEIATVGKITSWTDNTASPGTTYTYELVAYNTSGQDSGRSNPATVTTPSGSGSNMLHDKSPGTVVTFSGRQWIILEQMPNGETYLILKELDPPWRAFDPDKAILYNPSDTNNIAYYLNNDFYNSLSQKSLISGHSWDRVSFTSGEDGYDYGNVNCNIGLLSAREYERYRDASILPLDPQIYYWWLRTPGAESMVCIVNEYYNGTEMIRTISGGSPQLESGVRPTIYLQAGLLVDENGNVVEGTSNPPAAPIGLYAVATSPTTVNLTWQANTETDLAGYKIYRNNVEIATVGKVTSWTDNTASPGTTYTYELVAYNISGQDSGRSNPATVTTPNLPTPTQLGAIWKGNYIEVSWEAGDTQLGSHAVLWRQMDNGPWTPIKTLTNAERTGFTYNDRNVGVGLNCRYEIRESGIDNYFRWKTVAESGWATGDRPIKAPGGLRIASVDDNTAVITWNPIASVSNYIVQYSVNGQDWQAGTASGTSATVPRPSKVRVKAEGSYSHWSGVLSIR